MYLGCYLKVPPIDEVGLFHTSQRQSWQLFRWGSLLRRFWLVESNIKIHCNKGTEPKFQRKFVYQLLHPVSLCLYHFNVQVLVANNCQPTSWDEKLTWLTDLGELEERNVVQHFLKLNWYFHSWRKSYSEIKQQNPVIVWVSGSVSTLCHRS